MSLTDAHLDRAARRDDMGDWTERAACKGRPDLMDPAVHTKWTLGAALALCHHCPALEPCRQWALSISARDDPGFVAGGLTEDDRRRMRSARATLHHVPAAPTAAGRADRLDAYAELRAAGLDMAAAARRLGISARTARRYEQHLYDQEENA